MKLKHIFITTLVICFTFINNAYAEKFIPTYATYTLNGKTAKVENLSSFPHFNVSYDNKKDIVTIQCDEMGKMVLRKKGFTYNCQGVINGLIITANAHVSNNKVEYITYEEWDMQKEFKCTITYKNK